MDEMGSEDINVWHSAKTNRSTDTYNIQRLTCDELSLKFFLNRT